MPEASILSGVRALQGLAPAFGGLFDDAAVRADIERARARGYFAPQADERLQAWFARYLTLRAGLLETIADLAPVAMPDAAASSEIDEDDRAAAFLIAFAATCLLVRAARRFITEIASDRITQRKLNEGSARHRIPRRQYTIIYRSVTSPRNAWRIAEALRYLDAHRGELDALGAAGHLNIASAAINEHEDAVRMGVRDYLRARLRYRWHSWRRRRASAIQRAMFAIFEASGRMVADVRYRGLSEPHRVNSGVIAALEDMLRPGDVMITRHDHALTNLFLPGFWPHASLHIGRVADRDALGVMIDDARRGRWVDPLRVLEAKKDGVRFRRLEETLAVDAVAVIRPVVSAGDLAEALCRAVSHEGKPYNFDFDFFTEDKLVCTEVVYRAFDGVGPIRFDLRERAGRLTLSAEDVLDLAVEGRGFEAVALFGTLGCERELVTGTPVADMLAASYSRRSIASPAQPRGLICEYDER